MQKQKLNASFRSLYSAQFRALFLKDVQQLFQGQLAVYMIRILIPVVLMLILYIIPLASNSKAFSGITAGQQLSAMQIPRCFAVASKQDKVGLGARLPSKKCTTLAYFPDNAVTRQVMADAALSGGLNAKDIVGFADKAAFEAEQKKQLLLFGVEFTAPDFADLDASLAKLEVMLYYNQTYVDNPSYWFVFGKETISKELTMDFGTFKMSTHSSVPMVVQMHIQKALLAKYNVGYDPYVRSNPYMSNSGIKSGPNIFLSVALFLITIVLQFIFVGIRISQDKSSGTLEALRLAGTADFVYWGEMFTFQFMIFFTQLILQMFICYGLPGGNDIFAWVPSAMVFQNLLFGGLYSTALAILLGSFSSPALMIFFLVIIFAIMLLAIILTQSLGSTMFRDPSVIPTGFLRWLVRWIFPYSQITAVTQYIFSSNAPQIFLDYETMDYSLIDGQSKLKSEDYLKYRDLRGSLDATMKYSMPPPTVELIIPFFQAVVMLFGAWLIAEYQPTYASAHRWPHQLFTTYFMSTKEYGFTKKSQYIRTKKLFAKKCARKPLPGFLVDECIQEGQFNENTEAKEFVKQLLASENQENTILLAHHLHKTFKRPRSQRKKHGKFHHAVQSVSLQIHQGEVFGLAGHNGAGKSTTLGMITGAVKFDKAGFRDKKTDKKYVDYVNNAWVENSYDMRNSMHLIRRRLGFCPQFNTNVYQELTVYQNLQFICRLQNIPEFDHDRLISNNLKGVGLYDWKDKKLSQLSGGMQRRVSICVALINPQTRLVILDEPTTGLDPQTKRVIWSLIKHTSRNKRHSAIIDKNKEGETIYTKDEEAQPGIILTSHDMVELDTLSDNIGVMSAGKVVAQGTSLNLKRRFGKGFMLTVLSNSHEHRDTFIKEFGVTCQEMISKPFEILDKSGNVVVYSVPQEFETNLAGILDFIEQKKTEQDSGVVDFTLERTSMDEVFTSIGQQYEMDNGKGDNNLDFDHLKEEDVNSILHPPIAKPSIFKSILYKNTRNDKLTSTGILSFILAPIILVIAAFLIGDIWLPYMMGKMTSAMGSSLEYLEALCQLCGGMKTAGMLITQCNNFDSWAFPGVCKEKDVFEYKTFQPQKTYFGGDTDKFDTGTNLYNLQEYAPKMFVFDERNLFGQLPDLSHTLGTETTLNSVFQENGTYVPGAKTILDQMVTTFRQNNAYDPAKTFSYLPIKLTARQTIDVNNIPKNEHTITRDMIFDNGVEQFENTNNIEQQMLKYLRKKYIHLPALPVASPVTEEQKIEFEANLSKGNPNYRKNESLYLRMDEKHNIQFLKKYLAEQLPVGFIDTNIGKYQSQFLTDSKLDHKYGFLISGFLPSKTDSSFYQGYRVPVKLIPDIGYKMFLDKSGLPVTVQDKFFSQMLDVRLQPDLQPNILVDYALMKFYSSAISNIFDVSSRMTQALLKQHGNENFNIQFGMQHFEHTYNSLIETTASSFSLMMVVMMVAVGALIGINKYGSHIVQDRESGMRRQLYLNGVDSKIYWLANFVYSFGFAFLIQFCIVFIGSLVVQSKTFVRISPDMLVIHAIGGAIACVCTSYFLSSFFKVVSYYTAASVIVIIASVIVIVVNLDFVSPDPTFIAFILPPMAYVAQFSYISYNGCGAAEFFKTGYGILYIWEIMESILMMFFAIWLDVISSYNGYIPQPWYWPMLCCRKSKNSEASRSKQDAVVMDSIIASPDAAEFNQIQSQDRVMNQVPNEVSQISQALGDDIRIGTSQIVSFGGTVELNQVRASVKPRTIRDFASLHNEDRMDLDVLEERKRIKEGIPQQSPVVVVNLERQFGDFLALRDMSFHIPQQPDNKGCVFALLGPNGAAKTTTINLMIGLLKPTHGDIYLFGKNMSTEAVKVYPYLGLCSQFDVFLPSLTVRHHLVLFASIHGVAWKQINNVVQKLAEFVHLDAALDKQVRQLSGGMKRRMSLALALIG